MLPPSMRCTCHFLNIIIIASLIFWRRPLVFPICWHPFQANALATVVSSHSLENCHFLLKRDKPHVPDVHPEGGLNARPWVWFSVAAWIVFKDLRNWKAMKLILKNHPMISENALLLAIHKKFRVQMHIFAVAQKCFAPKPPVRVAALFENMCRRFSSYDVDFVFFRCLFQPRIMRDPRVPSHVRVPERSGRLSE